MEKLGGTLINVMKNCKPDNCNGDCNGQSNTVEVTKSTPKKNN